jgi:CRP-like cAMP-binding protein
MAHPSVEEVAALPLFAGLSNEELARLCALSIVESYPAGTTIFREGDPPGDLYVVLDGRVTLCTRIPGQSEACYLSLRTSELLGWSALLRKPRVATARVVSPARVLRFDASELICLCETDTRVGYAILRSAFAELTDRLQSTRLQLLDMFGQGG